MGRLTRTLRYLEKGIVQHRNRKSAYRYDGPQADCFHESFETSINLVVKGAYKEKVEQYQN